jgi:23S rRNA (guanine745-N1)-methyltransferase
MAVPVQLLACPHCGGGLAAGGGVLGCAQGHAFDIARQGYVNLLPGGAHMGTADTPAMVAARVAFLAAGHYGALADAVAGAAAEAVSDGPPVLLEVGAGTGFYLATALDRLPACTGLGLDISKHAARRAARAHPRMSAIVCDAWGRLPLRDGVAGAVLCVFAPRNAAEFARILAPGGAVVVAAPTQRHLAELVEPLGLISVDAEKDERLEASLGERFERESEELVEAPLRLTHDDVAALVGMGPSSRHVMAEELARRIAALPDPVAATLSVTVSVWRLQRGAPE